MLQNLRSNERQYRHFFDLVTRLVEGPESGMAASLVALAAVFFFGTGLGRPAALVAWTGANADVDV